MTQDETGIWERQGAAWGFSMDLTHAPNHIILTMRGQASEARNRALIELMQELLPRATDDEGFFYPLIVDLRQSGNPSMANLRLGRDVLQSFGAWLLYGVVVLDPHRRDSGLARNILSILEKLTAGQRLAVAGSMEEALLKVRTFHDHYEKAG